MIAIISDLHSNLEALEAVLEDIDARGIKRIFCTGDLVGYGPDPLAVMELVNRFEFSVIGNHDLAVINSTPDNFNPVAKRASTWTRKELNPHSHKGILKFAELKKKKNAWQYFHSLEKIVTVGDKMFVHDTPVAPGSSGYIQDLSEVQEAFRMHPEYSLFFLGHSHIPRVYTSTKVIHPKNGREYPISKQMLINVGSVGQPRDGDIRACYVVLAEGIRFFRVSYDIDTTIQKILANPELDNFLARRLLMGR